jgi:hypothetical protein
MIMEKLNIIEEDFLRFYHEHARLYAPEAADSLFKLTPVDHTDSQPRLSAGKLALKKKSRRKKIRGGPKPAPDDPDTQEDLFADDSRSHDDEQSSIAAPFDEEPVTADDEIARSKPRTDISATPQESIPLFEDTQFDLDAPGAMKVDLVWRSSDGRAQRAAMDHLKASRFGATIGLADGEWHLAFDVDGDVRPDPREAQKIIVRPDGLFSTIRLTRYIRLCNIHNDSDQDVTVRLAATVPWIETDGELTLPPKQTVKATARFLPRLMTEGRNEGALQVLARREGKDIILASNRIEVVAETSGAVPVIRYSPDHYERILQGIDRLELTLEIAARGRGSLNGMIYLPQQGEVADFSVRVGDPPFQKTFTIDSSLLAHKMEGALKVNVVTDSYLANFRQFAFELPYTLIFLKKSLPALSFGRVRKGMTQALRLAVERSDGEEVDIEARIPPSSAHCLEAFRARADAYSFRFDTRELQPGAKLDEAITLVDRRSGLRDHIKALGEVIANRAQEATAQN